MTSQKRLEFEQDSWVSLSRLDPHKWLSRANGDAGLKISNGSQPPESGFVHSFERSQNLFQTARQVVMKQMADSEFQVDYLASNIYRLQQDGEAADRLAGLVLGDSETVLTERGISLQKASRIESLPLQEVMRSFSRINP